MKASVAMEALAEASHCCGDHCPHQSLGYRVPVAMYNSGRPEDAAATGAPHVGDLSSIAPLVRGEPFNCDSQSSE